MIFHTHTQIHNMTKRALPDQMLKYKHALMLYKLYRQCIPNEEFIGLNFQANLNQRLQYHNFIKRQNYSVGSNILLNRLCCLNNEILQSMTDETYLSYKIKCKKLFLSTQNEWTIFVKNEIIWLLNYITTYYVGKHHSMPNLNMWSF